MPDPDRNPAAAWLLAGYDAADPDEIGMDVYYDHDLDQYWRPVYVQPIFTLKSVTDPGAAMHVTASDYNDPGRWWL